MKVKELRGFLLGLSYWVRHNPSKITKKVRAKHFLEDVSYVIHWLDDERINPTIQRWRHESIPKSLVKLFGIKQEIELNQHLEDLEGEI